MSHMFKVSSINSDLFIRALDLSSETIDYDVRHKETGTLMEPSRSSKFTYDSQKIYFDARFIPLDLVTIINETLN